MSTLNVATLQNSGGTGTAATLASINGGPISGARNRVINGSMVLDQRNAGAAVTVSAAGAATGYVIDRFAFSNTITGGTMTVQRSTVAPPGFSFSCLITNGASVTATGFQRTAFWQPIEGFNFADFNYGTANAVTATVSFWVRSSITGTYAGSIFNEAANRSYVFTYSVNSANTWEQKSVTIPGDTSGTWVGATNGIGAYLFFDLGSGPDRVAASGSWVSSYGTRTSGSTNWVGTNGATFYITGVQLEAGTVATPFERRSYGQELALCQRYFERKNYNSVSYERIVPAFVAGTSTSTNMESVFSFSEKRALPSITTSAANTFRQNGGNVADNIATSVWVGTIAMYTFNFSVGGNSRNSGAAGWISRENVATCFIEISAEL